MTGGLAWIYDENGDFLSQGRYHNSFLQPESWMELDNSARQSIRELVELHFTKTASSRGQWLLANWDREAKKFVRLTPLPQT